MLTIMLFRGLIFVGAFHPKSSIWFFILIFSLFFIRNILKNFYLEQKSNKLLMKLLLNKHEAKCSSLIVLHLLLFCYYFY